ncbi:MAG: glycine dehydrogenase, partial [Alicyclobacillus sp.]|nr:glycine dehydrogenase [Alicyclobacillus sp.]
LAAAVYLAYTGSAGLRDVALQNYHKAHYLAQRLTRIKGVELAFAAPFFNEFVLRLPVNPLSVQKKLREEYGILFGYALARDYPELADSVLLTVTEVRTRAELDRTVEALEGCL